MYLVTGASGHFGTLVLNHMLDTLKVPPSQIIATTRKPASLAPLAARGVVVRAADFDDEAGLVKAFTGATRLLLISTDAMDRPGRRLEQHRRAIAAASKAGVQHIVYTSMPNPENSAVTFAPDHVGTEKAIAEAGLSSWTILRNNWYFENLLYSVPQALAAGTWYSAAGDGRIAHISRADLAAAAATILAGKETSKSTYTLTGTTGYTTAEIAKLVADAVGKPLAVVPVNDDALVKGIISAGLPEPVARIFASFDANTRAGGVASVTTDVKSITGKEPQDFPSWLKANANSFAA